MANSRMRVTTLLGTNMFFSGVTYAATMPYASLVGVETLGMSPGLFASVISAGAILGTFVSLGLGYLSDKLRDRRLLVLLTAFAGILARGLIYLWPTQASFAVALIMPFAGASYGQSFGYVQVYYVKHMPARADFMVTVLRTVFTLAWIIVPPLAGWLAAQFSIVDVYLASTLSYMMMGAIFAVLISDKATAVQVPTPMPAEGTSQLSVFALRPGILAGLIGLVVMTGAMRLLNLTLSLFIVTDLGGSVTDVGLYAGITPATEAPLMLVLAWLTTRVTKETLLAAAGLVMALFIGLVRRHYGTATIPFNNWTDEPRMTTGNASYIICGTPRSGSTLLCEMLWTTRVAGRPNSYYSQQDILYWADKWDVPHPEGTENAEFDRAYLAAMLLEGSAETGLFGIRIMWSSIADTSKRLARVSGADGNVSDQLEKVFGRTLYVHVTRDDKIAQAVSRLRAEQSGVWHLAADGTILEGTGSPKAVSYDRERLAQLVADLHDDDAAWNRFFKDGGIEPLRLTYETTMSNPQAALAKVLTALQLNPEVSRDIPTVTAKMADSTNQEWIERYRRESA